MLRTYTIRERSVALYELKPFKNHSKNNYYEKYAGSVPVRSKLFKAIVAKLWIWFGVKI